MAKVLGVVKYNEDSIGKHETELKRNSNFEQIEPLEFKNQKQERKAPAFCYTMGSGIAQGWINPSRS